MGRLTQFLPTAVQQKTSNIKTAPRACFFFSETWSDCALHRHSRHLWLGLAWFYSVTDTSSLFTCGKFDSSLFQELKAAASLLWQWHDSMSVFHLDWSIITTTTLQHRQTWPLVWGSSVWDYLFIYSRLIYSPQSTGKAWVRAFHKFNYRTSWIPCKTCTLHKRKTYKHNPKVSPFGIALVKKKGK